MIQQNSSTTLYQHLNLSYNTTEQVSVANFCHFVLKPKMNLLKVMGQTPSYRISIKLEKPLLNYSSNRLKNHFLNGLECVHFLLIKHPIFEFEQSNIKLQPITIY